MTSVKVEFIGGPLCGEVFDSDVEYVVGDLVRMHFNGETLIYDVIEASESNAKAIIRKKNRDRKNKIYS